LSQVAVVEKIKIYFINSHLEEKMSWQIDTTHTQIGFTIRHMMISKVRGVFEKFNGTVNLDENNPANTTVAIQIEAASINTRDANRDGHLRSPDFFMSEKYPYIVFKSKSVKVSDNYHAKLVGDLTIRDVTHEVTLEVEHTGFAKSPWGTISAGFEGNTRINRKDWGLTWNKALETGGVLVADEIDISIELELVKTPEVEQAAA
jgi:polyisoprenoid-binding protein YceI